MAPSVRLVLLQMRLRREQKAATATKRAVDEAAAAAAAAAEAVAATKREVMAATAACSEKMVTAATAACSGKDPGAACSKQFEQALRRKDPNKYPKRSYYEDAAVKCWGNSKGILEAKAKGREQHRQAVREWHKHHPDAEPYQCDYDHWDTDFLATDCILELSRRQAEDYRDWLEQRKEWRENRENVALQADVRDMMPANYDCTSHFVTPSAGSDAEKMFDNMMSTLMPLGPAERDIELGKMRRQMLTAEHRPKLAASYEAEGRATTGSDFNLALDARVQFFEQCLRMRARRRRTKADEKPVGRPAKRRRG